MSNIINLDFDPSISVLHFEILTPQVVCGEDLSFTFTVQNSSSHAVSLDIDYEICRGTEQQECLCELHKISRRKCPVGYLLYNRSHTIPRQEVSAQARPIPAETADIISFPASRPLPCELRLVINGRRLAAAPFEILP